MAYRFPTQVLKVLIPHIRWQWNFPIVRPIVLILARPGLDGVDFGGIAVEQVAVDNRDDGDEAGGEDCTKGKEGAHGGSGEVELHSCAMLALLLIQIYNDLYHNFFVLFLLRWIA